MVVCKRLRKKLVVVPPPPPAAAEEEQHEEEEDEGLRATNLSSLDEKLEEKEKEEDALVCELWRFWASAVNFNVVDELSPPPLPPVSSAPKKHWTMGRLQSSANWRINRPKVPWTLEKNK